MKRYFLFITLLIVTSICHGAEEGDSDVNQPSGSENALETRADFLLRADPQTILRIRKKIDNYSAAKSVPLQHDYEPAISQDMIALDEIFEVSMEPDGKVPKVFLSKYQSTAISFVDAYGKPWPIRKVSNFLGPEKILIDQAVSSSGETKPSAKGEEASPGIDPMDPQAGSFTMTAVEDAVVGNLTVFLQGNPTPLSIMVVGKPAMYHRMATIKVNDMGPQTNKAELFQNNGVQISTETDADLNHALYGVSPQGSEEMVVQGGEGKAWLKGDALFIRTPLAVFSPRVLRSSPGNGKYWAFKLVATTTVAATNDEGKTVYLKILKHPSSDSNDKSTFR